MNVELCASSVEIKALPVFVYFTCSVVAMIHVIVIVMSVLASSSVCLLLDLCLLLAHVCHTSLTLHTPTVATAHVAVLLHIRL